jgi:hypothetical protein
MSKLKWSEPKPPTNNVSSYDHTICETPLGNIFIEWKSWKESPSYDVMLNGGWIGSEYSLEDAKKLVEKYLVDYAVKLNVFLSNNYVFP